MRNNLVNLLLLAAAFGFVSCAHSNRALSSTGVPALFQSNSVLHCQASRLIAGEKNKAGEVAIEIDSSSDLLVSASFRKEPKRNFRFGRRFADGRDLREKDDYKCAYFFDAVSDAEAGVKYVCSDLEEPSAIAREGFSSFVYRANEKAGAVCMAAGACWELSGCQ